MTPFNPVESRTSQRTIRFALLASLAFLLTAFLAIRIVAHYQEVGDRLERAERLLSGAAVHVSHLFERTDQVLRYAVESVAGRSFDTIAQAELVAIGRAALSSASTDFSIAFWRADGSLAVGLRGPDHFSHVASIADRTYFRAVVDADFPADSKALISNAAAGFVVGEPIVGRVQERPIIPVARAVLAADGSIVGVVVATLAIDAVFAGYEALLINPNDVLFLFRNDRTGMARLPVDERFSGRKLPNALVWQNYPATMSGRFEGAAATDGIRRMGVHQGLAPLPLVIGHSLEVSAITWGFVLRDAPLMAAVGLALLALLGFGLVADRTQAALALAQGQARSILESLDDVVWSTSADGSRLNFVSGACERLYGKPPGDFESDRGLWLAAVHPDDRDRVLDSFGGIDFSRERYEATYRIVHANGSLRWVRGRAKGLLDKAGTVIRIDGIVSDITELVATTTRLAASESRLTAMLQATVDALITIDDAGRIEHFNAAAERLFGYRTDEVIGRNVGMLMPEPEAPGHDDQLQSYLQGRPTRVIGVVREASGRRRDGTLFPMEISVGEWRDGDERHFIAQARDLTQKRTTEAALRQAQKLEAIGRLAGGIAHDFNNLLTPILGYAELLQESLPAGSPEREDVDVIARAARRGKDLVTRLKTSSRGDSDDVVPIQVAGVVTELIGLVQPTLPRGVVLSAPVIPLQLHVLADASKLQRVLLNLVSNSVDALEERGGRITVTAAAVDRGPEAGSRLAAGPYILIAVTDDGCGIPPAVVERLFEPFFTTKEVGRGTGLGLSLAYGFVTGWGGDIRVESVPGEGTTVTLLLPAAAAPPPPEQADA